MLRREDSLFLDEATGVVIDTIHYFDRFLFWLSKCLKGEVIFHR